MQGKLLEFNCHFKFTEFTLTYRTYKANVEDNFQFVCSVTESVTPFALYTECFNLVEPKYTKSRKKSILIVPLIQIEIQIYSMWV